MENLLSNAEIQKTENLNTDAVKFYLNLAEQRLKDTIEVKKEFEYRTNALFAGYASVALALFGLAEKFDNSAFWFNVTSVILCLAIVPLFLALKSSDYGNIGRHPKDWLETKDYIAVAPDKMSLIYAYALRSLAPRIDQSIASNNSKAKYLNIAVLLGMSSLLPFIIKALFCL